MPWRAGNQAYAQLDHVLTSQAYMLSTVDYFTLLGWGFMGLILLVWLAKPPFAAKRGLQPPATKPTPQNPRRSEACPRRRRVRRYQAD